MAGEWKRMTLGDFVTLQRGHDLPEESRRPGHVPILGSFGITGWHDTAKTRGPGVTVGRSGASFGVVSYSANDYWPLNTALYVIDFHGNDERCAYYLLKQFDFKSYNSGSAQPSLNRNFIHPVPVDVPPLPEQRAIAHILGTLDDKIELNRRMTETLETMARTLFKSWFVDFDPVRAKVEGRDPGISRCLTDLFPARLVATALGEYRPVGASPLSVTYAVVLRWVHLARTSPPTTSSYPACQ
jgi:type I restriction enzyme S subunit